jgi:hypothetical protein
MPCTGNITSEEWAQMAAQDAQAAARRLHEEVGQLSSVLCCLCRYHEANGTIDEVLRDDTAKTWWENHKKLDAARGN